MKKGRKKKDERHDLIVNHFEETKAKHLEKLASIMLKNDDVTQKLKEKNIDDKFLDLF